MVTAVSPTYIKPSDGDKDWGENGININSTNQENFNDQVVADLETNETALNGKADLVSGAVSGCEEHIVSCAGAKIPNTLPGAAPVPIHPRCNRALSQ